MLTLLAAGVLSAMVVTQTDRTVPAQRGARLEVDNFAGEVNVKAWDRDEVRVQAGHSDREQIEVTQGPQVISVSAESDFGPTRSIDFQITVPRWMRVGVSGTYIDVVVEGTEADITAETVRGTVIVKGGSGVIELKSVEGEVSLERARGKLSVSSVNEAIRVADSTGDITAETVNGGVTLERLSASTVDAATVNGDILFSGAIGPAGRYSMNTHNGDITVTLPANVNVTVTARTYNGSFGSAFAARAVESGGSTKRQNKRMEVTLGTGGARMDLESFGGEILVRPAVEAPRK